MTACRPLTLVSIATGILLVLVSLGALAPARAAAPPFPLPLTITGTPNVNVANPASAPALTRDVDNGAFQPVRFRVTAHFNDTTVSQTSSDGPTVPAGKRLVVESIYVFGIGTDAEELTAVWLSPKVNPDQQTYLMLNPTSAERQTNGGNSIYGYARNIRAYFNPGETLLLELFRGPTTGPLSTNFLVNAYVQGYYINLP